MAAPKQNFLNEHWDWLVTLVGVGALAASGYFFLMSPKSSNIEELAKEYLDQNLLTKARNEKIEAADLTELKKALRGVEKPASIGTIDPKAKSFLASESRVFCENKECRMPIPAMAEMCPECKTPQNVVKIEADADHDGMPNDWEKKYGLNPDNAADAALDADGDSFTNLEEFQAGTDPKDKTSHPDYLDSLSVAGNIQDTTLDFYFKDAQQIRDGYRFTFQRMSGMKSKSSKRTYTAVMNGEITTGESDARFCEKSGWKVVGFEQKKVDEKIAGSLQTKKVDASEVMIERLDDGRKVKLVIVPNPKTYASRMKTALESRIDLTWNRGEGKTLKGLSEGASFELNERKYKVVKLGKANGAVEVTVQDLAAGKEKIIR